MQRITFKAPVFDQSGYATLCRNIVLALHRQNTYEVVIEPVRWLNASNVPLENEEDILLHSFEEKAYAEDYIQKMKEDIVIHASIALEFLTAYPQKKAMGFCMLETDFVPQLWAQKMNLLNGVIVPSYFCMSSFMKSGVNVPIRTVPLGVDFDIFKPDGEKLLLDSDITTSFNFITVGQWTQLDRKNIGETFKIFLETFRDRNDVGLIAKVNNLGTGTTDKIQCIERLHQLRRSLGFTPNSGPKIYLVHGTMTQDEMARLYRNAHAFVLPSMGEAWGMPILEAAASGLPVITTGGTGAETFMNPEYSILLNYKWQQIPQRMYWQGVYEPHQQMTMPDFSEFSRMMKRIVDKYDLAKDSAIKQREELVQREFTWKKTAENLMVAIEEMSQ